jgi:Ca2+-binding RTX toxin-like protein
MARINGTGAPDVLTGGAEPDIIRGRGGDDRLNGDSGFPISISNDTLFGGAGNDSLTGGPGNDRMVGGGGNDFLVAGDGRDFAFGGGGRDTVFLGYSLRDGVSGSDIRIDTVAGGAGLDTLQLTSFLGTSVSITGNLASGAVVSLSGEPVARASGFEAVYVSTTGDRSATVVGGTGSDYVTLQYGLHEIRTGAGNDLVSVVLDPQRDLIDLGGGSSDHISINYGGRAYPLVFDLTKNGEARVNGDVWARIRGAETMDILGGAADDRLSGGSGADSLYGGLGSDRLNGRGGNDRIGAATDPGLDRINGGAGHDTLFANSFTGSIDMAGTSGKTVRIAVDGSATTVGRKFEQVEILGSDKDDTLIGLNGDDILSAGIGGNDILRGNGGDDVLRGASAAGTDIFFGGAGADVFELRPSDIGQNIVRDFTAEDSLSQAALFLPAQWELVVGRDPTPRNGIATLLFDTDTGDLSLDYDGTGTDGAASVFARLLNRGAPAELTEDQIL